MVYLIPINIIKVQIIIIANKKKQMNVNIIH